MVGLSVPTPKKEFRKLFEKIFEIFSILAGGRCPPDPLVFGWGGKASPDPPLDGFSRGAAAPRTLRVLFFASDDTGAARTSGRTSG